MSSFNSKTRVIPGLPTIAIVRDVYPRSHDFKVFIDGEHRANFRRRLHGRSGYKFVDTNDLSIMHWRKEPSGGITESMFFDLVSDNIASFMTSHEQEMYRVRVQAEIENRERDTQDRLRASLHRDEVRKEVLSRALKLYLWEIERDWSVPTENREMAVYLLKHLEELS